LAGSFWPKAFTEAAELKAPRQNAALDDRRNSRRERATGEASFVDLGSVMSMVSWFQVVEPHSAAAHLVVV
jgi:hypothetical protein